MPASFALMEWDSIGHQSAMFSGKTVKARARERRRIFQRDLSFVILFLSSDAVSFGRKCSASIVAKPVEPGAQVGNGFWAQNVDTAGAKGIDSDEARAGQHL
jgi:hypothetical protein